MAINKVLVVDDIIMSLEQIKQVVEEAGLETISATSGKEAVEKAITSSPDLIFMDIVMPEMDGFAACRELTKNEKTRAIPIVFVSSKDQEADKVWAELQGAKAYITKPYTAEQILAQIKAFE